MNATQPAPEMDRPPTGRLRVLETTDLHMHLLAYDYFSDSKDDRVGLIGLIPAISALRADPMITTVLCDNGDTLQGTPLADYTASEWADAPHPMIAAMNALDYDAMALGNHDFDFGLPFLRRSLADATFPVVCSNVHDVSGAPIAMPWAFITRLVPCDDGIARPITIGIIGFAPPQVADWDQKTQSPTITTDDIIEAAQRDVPRMKAAGADLIIALCHSGIGETGHLPRMENAAVPLAAIDGVDVLLTGHTHARFPDRRRPSEWPVDCANGTLHGKPAVMAGYYGTALGVIDLALCWDRGGWHVSGYNVRLEQGSGAADIPSAQQAALRKLVAAPHAATLAKLAQPIARTRIPIHSYFSTVVPDLSQQLLARATQDAVQTAMDALGYGDLPVLAAKSPFRAGGAASLGHFIDVPAGPITLRDAAAIFPFADVLCAWRRTGADLRLWLERAASHYNQITPNQPDQPLIHPDSLAYNCDTLYGLRYQIDLTQPAKFDVHGRKIAQGTSRVTALTYHGKPVADDDIFIVATNSFRTHGGGNFPKAAPSDILHTSSRPTQKILIDYLQRLKVVTNPVYPTWSFAPIPGSSAIFQSAAWARTHLQRPLGHCGPGALGLDNYRITF